jgi:hypothetical protein
VLSNYEWPQVIDRYLEALHRWASEARGAATPVKTSTAKLRRVV